MQLDTRFASAGIKKQYVNLTKFQSIEKSEIMLSFHKRFSEIMLGWDAKKKIKQQCYVIMTPISTLSWNVLSLAALISHSCHMLAARRKNLLNGGRWFSFFEAISLSRAQFAIHFRLKLKESQSIYKLVHICFFLMSDNVSQVLLPLTELPSNVINPSISRQLHPLFTTQFITLFVGELWCVQTLSTF